MTRYLFCIFRSCWKLWRSIKRGRRL